MEQKEKQYKLYASKVPIWWNKMSENRPSSEYFHSFNFDWIELPINMGYITQFRGHIVLKEDTFTYFKMVHLVTNKTTYWFVDDINHIMEKGHDYLLGLDLWCSYNMEIFDNIPDTMPIGIERTHLTIDDYYKYNNGGVVDTFIATGNNGVKIAPLKMAFTSQNRELFINQHKDNNPNESFPYVNSFDIVGNTKAIVRSCYVLTNDGFINNGDEYAFFPIAEIEAARRQGLGNDLGNTPSVLQALVKEKPSRLIGIFILPFWQPEFKLFYKMTKSINNKTYDFFLQTTHFFIGRPYGEVQDVVPVFKCLKKWKYNNQDETTELNCYSAVNSNIKYLNAQITPIYTWLLDKDNKDYFHVKIGFTIFNKGFCLLVNTKDPMIQISNTLPVNTEAYDRYLSGIRESMNTAIKVSNDNMIMGIVKGTVGAGTSVVQTAFGAAAKDPITTLKGVSNFHNSIFNLAGSIVNHQNTKATFDAQLRDAQNSIPHSIADSNNADISIFELMVNIRDDTFGMPITSFTPEMTKYNNNLAFLFGVQVSNYIPYSVIKNMFKKTGMPMIYIEFQKAFLETIFDQYLTKKFPAMNQTLRRALLDGFRIGYRVWKVECDLTQTYEINIE